MWYEISIWLLVLSDCPHKIDQMTFLNVLVIINT